MFSDKLTELRTAAGLSQGDLARRVGLTRQAISSLEADRNVPTWETVQLLARVLEVSTDTFVDPNISLPQPQPKKPAGRPRTQPPAEQPRPRRRKKT